MAILVFFPGALVSISAALGVRCIFRALVGFPCPGCGVIRSLTALAHGDFAQAWLMNPAGLIVAIVLASQFLVGLLVQLGLVPFESRLRQALWGDTLVAQSLLVVWCARVLHLLPLS